MIADTDPGFSTLREWLNSQDCFSRKLLMFLGNYRFVVPIHLLGICWVPDVCNFGITRATTSLIVLSWAIWFLSAYQTQAEALTVT